MKYVLKLLWYIPVILLIIVVWNHSHWSVALSITFMFVAIEVVSFSINRMKGIS